MCTVHWLIFSWPKAGEPGVQRCSSIRITKTSKWTTNSPLFLGDASGIKLKVFHSKTFCHVCETVEENDQHCGLLHLHYTDMKSDDDDDDDNDNDSNYEDDDDVANSTLLA